MLGTRKLLTYGLAVALFLDCPGLGYADDAQVLPKGVFRTTLDSKFFFPHDKRYNPDGKVEDVAVDYNANLNSNLFPALAPLDPFVPGLPSIGDSIVSFKYHVTNLDLGFQYGVTDRLTVGINIPYWWVTNKVKARVNSAPGSSANVGKNPLFGLPGQSAFIPIALGGTRLTTEDVQNLLGRGLDINGDGTIDVAGFGFKRVETWEGKGLADIETGFRYQYLRTEDWRLAFTGGVRFPSGRVDDPDHLMDYAFGSGAYALLFRLNNDFVISNLWKAKPKSSSEGTVVAEPGDLVLNGTFRYDIVLPDREKKRVSNDVNNPIGLNKEKVKRDLGDIFEFDAAATYTLFKGLSFSALYRYAFKLEDRISGKLGLFYKSLEKETEATSHLYIIGLSFTTLPLYLEKKFPVPVTGSISYRNRFAGSNNALRSQYIALGLQILF